MMNGRFYFFLRLPGPAGLGHLGWGFQTENGFYAGSVENPGGSAFTWDGNGYWFSTYVDEMSMLQDMVTLKAAYDILGTQIGEYTTYKVLRIENPNIEEAIQAAHGQPTDYYGVTFDNCMDNAVDMALAYGVPRRMLYQLGGTGIPGNVIVSNWAPDNFFQQVQQGERTAEYPSHCALGVTFIEGKKEDPSGPMYGIPLPGQGYLEGCPGRVQQEWQPPEGQ